MRNGHSKTLRVSLKTRAPADDTEGNNPITPIYGHTLVLILMETPFFDKILRENKDTRHNCEGTV